MLEYGRQPNTTIVRKVRRKSRKAWNWLKPQLPLAVIVITVSVWWNIYHHVKPPPHLYYSVLRQHVPYEPRPDESSRGGGPSVVARITVSLTNQSEFAAHNVHVTFLPLGGKEWRVDCEQSVQEKTVCTFRVVVIESIAAGATVELEATEWVGSVMAEVLPDAIASDIASPKPSETSAGSREKNAASRRFGDVVSVHTPFGLVREDTTKSSDLLTAL